MKIYVSALFFVVLAFSKIAFGWTIPVASGHSVTNDFWSCGVACYHLGEDISASQGTEVRSIGQGMVVEVNYNPASGNYGGRVLVQYSTQIETVTAVYGHLGKNTDDPLTDNIYVSVGQSVNEGQALGRIGSTAENGGWPPHLHFGIHRGSYLGGQTECDRWTYAGYTAKAYSADNECYCAVLDNWYDPSEFLGISERDLRIVSGSVTPSPGTAAEAPFLWRMSADGGRGAPITASVIVRTPETLFEYPFIMAYA